MSLRFHFPFIPNFPLPISCSLYLFFSHVLFALGGWQFTSPGKGGGSPAVASFQRAVRVYHLAYQMLYFTQCDLQLLNPPGNSHEQGAMPKPFPGTHPLNPPLFALPSGTCGVAATSAWTPISASALFPFIRCLLRFGTKKGSG